MEATTNKEVRSNNRKRIVNLLFQDGEMPKQDIVKKLDMSLATVNYLVKELTEIGLLTTGKALGSTGGRKPVCIKPVYDAKCSIGVEATQDIVRIVVLNLGTHIVTEASYALKQENTLEYWVNVGKMIRKFAEENQFAEEKLLDIGITLGMTMQDESLVLRKASSQELEMDLELAKKGLGMPVHFRNSTKMAAVAECWRDNQVADSDFIFVYLGNKVSGACVQNKNVMNFAGINGELGCMVTCGNPEIIRIDTLYSKKELYKKGNCKHTKEFFEQLDNGNSLCVAAWDNYLTELSKFLYNLLCIFGWKIILGGSLSLYLKPYIGRIEAQMKELYPFENFPENILSVTTLGEYGAAAGAAMLPIDKFLEAVSE